LIETPYELSSLKMGNKSTIILTRYLLLMSHLIVVSTLLTSRVSQPLNDSPATSNVSNRVLIVHLCRREMSWRHSHSNSARKTIRIWTMNFRSTFHSGKGQYLKILQIQISKKTFTTRVLNFQITLNLSNFVLSLTFVILELVTFGSGLTMFSSLATLICKRDRQWRKSNAFFFCQLRNCINYGSLFSL